MADIASHRQLYFLKKRNPALKVLLSIGGWTYSSNFGPAAGTPHGRAAFARSATQLVETYGLDGLDVDWEVSNRTLIPFTAQSSVSWCHSIPPTTGRHPTTSSCSRRPERLWINLPSPRTRHILMSFLLQLCVVSAVQDFGTGLNSHPQPGAPSKIDVLRIKEMDKYLSFWNLMLYDFAGRYISPSL